MRCGFGVWMLVLVLVSPVLSFAQEEEVKLPEISQEKDEYDFSWLDPDKKIYVVQNRKYTKKHRIEFALNGGVGFGQTYRSTYTFMPRAIAYFNEHWGIEGIAGFNSNSENDDLTALKQVSGRIPTVRDVQQFYGISGVWLPFYGKLNMFNQLFYFDWYFSLGLSSVQSEIDLNTSNTGAPRIHEDTFTGMHWGTGWKFFVTRNFGVRLDYLGLYYKAPVAMSGTVEDGIEDTYDNHYLTLGVSYTF